VMMMNNMNNNINVNNNNNNHNKLITKTPSPSQSSHSAANQTALNHSNSNSNSNHSPPLNSPNPRYSSNSNSTNNMQIHNTVNTTHHNKEAATSPPQVLMPGFVAASAVSPQQQKEMLIHTPQSVTISHNNHNNLSRGGSNSTPTVGVEANLQVSGKAVQKNSSSDGDVGLMMNGRTDDGIVNDDRLVKKAANTVIESEQWSHNKLESTKQMSNNIVTPRQNKDSPKKVDFRKLKRVFSISQVMEKVSDDGVYFDDDFEISLDDLPPPPPIPNEAP
jgi:hypothetical protein